MRFLALLAIVLIMALGSASAITADCAPGVPANGATVTCTGSDTNGFTSSSTDLQVNVVAGATVSNTGHAIQTGDNADVLNNGTVTSTGADGINGGSNEDVTNNG